ncbi:hypothetical protein ABWH74_000058 [Burkholderia vietnamiensis]|uniref:Uncharacterized protein n=1 Tax=Burkholderia vietnamiensis TaxID=60552 RepID=A0ABS1B035_BURVI|nr:hypothetical protein [Burkholderia vietnamiensis]MBJ9689744.1 hypothetical protein [Burkholderia vietnamiensis]MBR8280923.1 hypothetical protein [Burkholderia vietnamiensis]MCA8011965.1 hypothetical protein [Burkholderia vietnamiensis]MCA8197222.1 hypothetical protein [Burkholderia vietnamiensis]MCA8287160.1 hypothetical protein [Burkholderia vietnamiensis]
MPAIAPDEAIVRESPYFFGAARLRPRRTYYVARRVEMRRVHRCGHGRGWALILPTAIAIAAAWDGVAAPVIAGNGRPRHE